MKLEIYELALFALPCWKQKTIDDSDFPDISIARRGKLARIAGVNSHLMREMVVDTKVGAPRIGSGQTVGRVRTVAKRLLHAEDWLKSANRTFGSSEM